jgi:uncharacterized protein YbcI
MGELKPSMAQQVAEAVTAFQERITGRTPQQVSVVLSDHTVVTTLHGAFSKGETALANSLEGGSRVREYHRHLFNQSMDDLRKEIQKITGVEVRDSTAEVATASGAVVLAFPTGTLVQVFLMAKPISPQAWDSQGKQLIEYAYDQAIAR